MLTKSPVKCDGKLPCSYCTRHKRAQTCHFTPQKRRRLNSVPSPASDQEHQPKRQQLQQHHSHHGENSNNTTTTAPPSSAHSSAPPDIAAASNSYHPASTSAQQQSHVVANITPAPTTVGSAASALRDSSVEEEAEVPRDARLLYDAQGKLSKQPLLHRYRCFRFRKSILVDMSLLSYSLYWRLRPAFLLPDCETIGPLSDRPPCLCTSHWSGTRAAERQPKPCCTVWSSRTLCRH
jgi:hypothetical protein